MKTITLYRNGATKTIPTGFSWTTLVFGMLPSLFRGHLSYFGYMVVADILSMAAMTSGISGIDALFVFVSIRAGFAYMRNDYLGTDLMKDGWIKSMATKRYACNEYST